MKKIMTFAIAALLAIGLAMGPAYAGSSSDASSSSIVGIDNQNTVNNTGTESESDAEAEAYIDNRNYGKSSTTRGIPGYIPNNPWPNAQYHNAPHTRTWNILPFVELAKVRRIWTRQQLEVILDWADGNDGDVTPVPYNAVPAETKKGDRSPLDTIAIIFSSVVPEGHHDTGLVQGRGDHDTNGVALAAAMMLDAMNMDGDYLMITVEDAEILQYTKARSFFIGGGMSAVGGDGPSGAMGGGGVSGIGAGSIRSGKNLAPHATAYVIEKNDDCYEVLDKGKTRCATEEEVATYRNALATKKGAASLDEAGRGPKPTVKDAKSGNGGNMKKFYLETDQ